MRLFFETVDVVVAKNWLKKIFDTLTDMELDDSLKLKVATRFMVRVLPLGGTILSFVLSPLSVGNYLFKNSMINFIPDSIVIKRDKNSSN